MSSWTVTVQFAVRENDWLDAADLAAELVRQGLLRAGRPAEVRVLDVDGPQQ